MRLDKFLSKVQFPDIILHEDEDIIVVNKPQGLSSLDDKEHKSLKDLAKAYWPDAQLCHRLDKMTSGALVIAKNPEAYRSLAMQFEQREIVKVYHALVEGVHQFDDYLIDLPLHVSSNKHVTIDRYEGKPAMTYVNTEHAFRGYTLLRCEPVTGRMHQIRVHLSAQGCPIVGDKLYGGKDMLLSDLKRKYKFSTKSDETPLNHDFLLHARTLAFTHPRTGEMVQFDAEYPKSFRVVLQNLAKFNAP